MWLELDREGPLALARQIYQQVRQMIHSGALASGHKLPSTRSLASEFAVSRNTVIEAYSQLIAEGYLKTYKGSGTVVAEGLRALDIVVPMGRELIATPEKAPPEKEIIDFRTGIPALEYFPRKEWSNTYRGVCQKVPVSGFGYCGASGIRELREAIAGYLYRTRGISCDAGQIMITSGTTQGLSLISHILRDNQKTVLVENPSHSGLRKVITTAGCSIEGVPADEKGLCTELLRDKRQVSFIYVTPSHQYPLGGILPIQRRLELVRYVEQSNCYVVEDDYDGEFRYEGPPVSSLYELNPQRVIYCGSFSKILAPALRLGFMVLPRNLIPACKKLKTYSDVHSDAISQYTLAQFIQTGAFEKHIWKMKKHYAGNRTVLLKELSKHFLGRFDVLGHAAGLHMVVRFGDEMFTKEIVDKIADNGVRIYPVDRFFIAKEQTDNSKIILGYSHLEPDKISKGIGIISGVIRLANRHPSPMK